MTTTTARSRRNLIGLAMGLVIGGAATVGFAMPPGGGGLFGADRIDSHLERMADHLDLTEAQQEQIRAILEQQAEDTQRNFAAVRDQIDTVLTEEQRALRDERMQERMERRLDRMANRLDLTDAQREQMAAIIAEKVANPELSPTELRESMASVLTEEQLEAFTEMRERRAGGPRHHGGR